MTRIDDKFAELAQKGKKAFVSYIMAGDPDFDTSLDIVRGLPAAGVDIIELACPSPTLWPMGPRSNLQVSGRLKAA